MKLILPNVEYIRKLHKKKKTICQLYFALDNTKNMIQQLAVLLIIHILPFLCFLLCDNLDKNLRKYKVLSLTNRIYNVFNLLHNL